jgi:hypothetical protein
MNRRPEWQLRPQAIPLRSQSLACRVYREPCNLSSSDRIAADLVTGARYLLPCRVATDAFRSFGVGRLGPEISQEFVSEPLRTESMVVVVFPDQSTELPITNAEWCRRLTECGLQFLDFLDESDQMKLSAVLEPSRPIELAA